jgi:hypothetical protein
MPARTNDLIVIPNSFWQRTDTARRTVVTEPRVPMFVDIARAFLQRDTSVQPPVRPYTSDD